MICVRDPLINLYVGAVFDFGHVAACSYAVVNTLYISKVSEVTQYEVEHPQGHSAFSSVLTDAEFF
jgi:hypothetical protein